MMRITLLPIVISFASGCGTQEGFADVLNVPEMTNAILRVDVLPSQAEDGVSISNQSISTGIERPWVIELSPTITVTGTVVGQSITPWTVSELPGEVGPIEGATVQFYRDNSIQSVKTTTNEFGEFQLDVVWDAEPYLLRIMPQDTLAPVYSSLLFQDDYSAGDLPEIDIGAGSAIYGQVRSKDGQELAEVPVYVQSEDKTESATTYTNKLGWYSIRVDSGRSYQIVAEGATLRDPVLRSGLIDVETEDVRHDMVYEEQAFGFVGGRVQDSQGKVVENVTIRFISQQLEGYTADGASHTYDVRPTSGLFDARLPPGRYRVEAIAASGSLASPAAIESIDVNTGEQELPTFILNPLQPVISDVLRPDGTPAPHVSIVCTEKDFGKRQFIGASDDGGTALLTLPDTPMLCELVPPTNITEAARTHSHLQGAVDGAELQLQAGELVVGSVLYPVPGGSGNEGDYGYNALETSILEFRNDTNYLMGSTSTSSSGEFSATLAAILIPDDE